MIRYFARRPTSRIFCPVICSRNFLGDGAASVRDQRKLAERIVLPIRFVLRFRAMVSTSGSSGIFSCRCEVSTSRRYTDLDSWNVTLCLFIEHLSYTSSLMRAADDLAQHRGNRKDRDSSFEGSQLLGWDRDRVRGDDVLDREFCESLCCIA